MVQVDSVATLDVIRSQWLVSIRATHLLDLHSYQFDVALIQHDDVRSQLTVVARIEQDPPTDVYYMRIERTIHDWTTLEPRIRYMAIHADRGWVTTGDTELLGQAGLTLVVVVIPRRGSQDYVVPDLPLEHHVCVDGDIARTSGY